MRYSVVPRVDAFRLRWQDGNGDADVLCAVRLHRLTVLPAGARGADRRDRIVNAEQPARSLRPAC